MSEDLDIRKLTEASRTAAKQAGVNEDFLNQALETICAADGANRSLFDIQAAINDQIGRAKTPELQQQLIKLRTEFEKEMLRTATSRIERAFKQGPEAGRQAWLTTMAEAITRFQITFCQNLCAFSFPFAESDKQTLERLQKTVRLMLQVRWAEAYEQIDELTRLPFLPVETQARLFVIAGEIQLYHVVNLERAREWFEKAERLLPDDFRVLSGMGEYWAEKKDPELARSYYERAIRSAPNMQLGYTNTGDTFDSAADLETASEWFLKAIEAASGESSAYEKLLRLYGRPELFTKHEGKLLTLMQQARAVCPEDEYQLYVDLGYCYEQNERLAEAQTWYEKAISVDPRRSSGYSNLAQLFEKQGRKEQAEATYKQAIEADPESYDGYWGLTWFYEKEERWTDALEWYQRVPQHIDEWTGIARARVGEMHWRLKNYALAEETLKQELLTHKTNETAKNILQSFAADYYKKLDDRESAVRVYDEMRRILGDEIFLGDYHNWLGNMAYYFDDYIKAAEEYLAAIAAAPDSAIFRRNLSEAYKQLKSFEQAREALQQGFAIDKDVKVFNRETSLLLNAEANGYYAQSDYRRAIELYEQAIKADAGNDVIFSNLAGSWELLREPGKRLEALDAAIAAYQRANKIKVTEKYEREIARLQTRRDYASRYGEKAIDWLHVVTPIAVEVAQDLIPLTEGSTPGTLSDKLSNHIAAMKARVQSEFGVKLPGLRFRGNESDFPPHSYLIMINEVPLVMGTLEMDQRFFPGSADDLKTLGVAGKDANNPLTGEKGFWIARDDWEKIEGAGHALWDVIEYLVKHLESVVQRNLVEFLGHQEIADIVQIESAASFSDLQTSPGKLTSLTSVCCSLVTEGVPITPFPPIYEAFDNLCSGNNLQEVAEAIRSLPSLRPRLPGNNPEFEILSLSANFETDIRNAVYRNRSGPVLAMEPENCQNALTAVRNELSVDRKMALVTEDAELRPFVRLLLEIEFPNNPILARRELRPDAEFRTVGVVELDAPARAAQSDFSHHRGIEVSNNGHESEATSPAEPELGLRVFVNENVLGNETGADEQTLPELFSLMQDGLFYELGIVLPETRVETDNTLNDGEFRIELNGRKGEPQQGLKRDEFLVNDTVERLRLLSIEARPAVNPANDNECAIVAGGQPALKTCRDAGLTTWGPGGFLVLTLSAEIRKIASVFQTTEITQNILESLRAAFPELITQARRRFSILQICLVLKDLLDEEISIRDMRSILESMLSISGTTDVDLSRYITFMPRAQNLCPVSGNRSLEDLTTSDYSDFVRTSLKRYISHKYTRGSNTLIVYLLDPDIEKRIGNLSAQPLTSEEIDKLETAIRLEFGSLPPTAQSPVLLTSMDVRRPLKKLIQKEFPRLVVLSYQELSPDLNIQPIARISWD
jgi:type III secretory pathway component EscV/tetratricopeptide (TPR) repeat protein